MFREVFTFSSSTESRAQHEDDHLWMHRVSNRAVYVDRYASIQTALDDASSKGIPVVFLNPRSNYNISVALTIPAGVTLDGGGNTHGANGATLRATSALDPMVSLESNGSGLRGCRLNANNQAVVGVLVRGNFNTVEACQFANFANNTDIAIKAGGALYTMLRRNLVANIKGIGLDALQSYKPVESQAYYGINHGASEQNVWGAKSGGIRIEGYLTSRNDDFEFALDGVGAVIMPGSVQTQLDMYSPYCELTKGSTEELVAIHASGILNLQGGQIFGDLSGSAIKAGVAFGGLSVMQVRFARWNKGVSGTMALNASVLVAGNTFLAVDTANDLTLGGGNVSLVHF